MFLRIPDPVGIATSMLRKVGLDTPCMAYGEQRKMHPCSRGRALHGGGICIRKEAWHLPCMGPEGWADLFDLPNCSTVSAKTHSFPGLSFPFCTMRIALAFSLAQV